MAKDNNTNESSNNELNYKAAEFMTSNPEDFTPMASGLHAFMVACVNQGIPPAITLELTKQYMVVMLNFARVDKGEQQ